MAWRDAEQGWQRYSVAKRMRDDGKTLREIGDALGISRSYVAQILAMGKRYEKVRTRDADLHRQA